jgi:hypothetical protein
MYFGMVSGEASPVEQGKIPLPPQKVLIPFVAYIVVCPATSLTDECFPALTLE